MRNECQIEAKRAYARNYMARRRLENPEAVNAARTKHREKPESRAHAAAKSREWHANNREHANGWRKVSFEKRRQERPWEHLFGAVKARAKRSKILFTLTPGWVEARWTGKCEITGIPFVISPGIHHPHPFSPSFDKIKRNLGYTPDNTRIILMAVNLLKYTENDAHVLKIAEAIVLNKDKLIFS